MEDKSFFAGIRARGTDSARVIAVIETIALKGCGTEEEPAHLIKQYWDFEGNLLAEQIDKSSIS